MCYALYIGADELLPFDSTGEIDGEFHLRALEGPDDERVRDKFGKPHVYYAASWQGCGCGWFPEAMPFALTAKRRAASRMMQVEKTAESVTALHDLMADVLTRHDTVELLLTWEGQQGNPPERALALAIDDFSSGALPLSEADFAVVTARPLG